MTPKQIFQTYPVAVGRLSSMLEGDTFLHDCLNTALNEYVLKQFANNANDALLLAGQLKGAKGVLDELRNLHKKSEPKRTEQGNVLDYASTSHPATIRPVSTRPSAGSGSAPERRPASPP
jgi:hypothetical protein